jgi:uncharacterized membrane protein YdjX (TVP38/TMEM64 family)
MIGITPPRRGRTSDSPPPTRDTSERPVPLINVEPAVSTLRRVSAAVATTARQLPRRRIAAIAIASVILVALVLLVPLPSALQLRDWSRSVGPWFPLAFLAAHVVVTVLPFPRTAFTLAAGLIFGPALGVGIALGASTLSAVIALVLVRAAGWQLARLVRHPRVDALNGRLEQRGWLTVLSMRLIPVVPFSMLNYVAGASAIRVLPFTLATVVGLLPGTAAIVIFGDALTGNVSPLLLLISVGTAGLGVAGLIHEVRSHRRHEAAEAAKTSKASETSETPVVTP